MPSCDVFVIGGGPAGLAAAIAASRRGMRVIVCDGNKPPVDKPCGEGLMPDARLLAARLGIAIPASAGFEFRGICFHGARRSVQADFSHGPGLGVRRTVLHQLLIDAAARAGVEFRWSTPVSAFDAIKARWIIGADGASSLVRGWAGLDDFVRTSRRFARRRHFAIAPWSSHVEIYWGEGCQIYVTPVAAHEVCVALVSSSPELRLEDAIRSFFPALVSRLRNAPGASRERGAVTGNVRLRRVAGGNVALIGDASGSVDAIAGEGICLGFRQAEVLADAIAQNNLSIYNRAHPRLAFRARLMANALLQLDCNNAAFRRFTLGALSARPWIFRKLLEAHAT